MACLAVYMQQIFEQYSLPFPAQDEQRDPTHCTNTIVCGCSRSDGRNNVPPVGPAAFIKRSSSKEVMTSLEREYPNSSNAAMEIGLNPVATTIAPYLSVR